VTLAAFISTHTVLAAHDRIPRVAIIGDYQHMVSTSLSRNPQMAWDVLHGAEFALDMLGSSSSTRAELEFPNHHPDDYPIRPQVLRLSDHGDDRRARAVALAAIFDPSIVCVIGHSRSSTSASAIPYYESAGMPVLLPIATTTAIRLDKQPIDNRAFVFRLPPSDAIQADSMFRLLVENVEPALDAPVVILFTDDAYGRPLARDIYARILNSQDPGHSIRALPPIPLASDDGAVSQVLSLPSEVGGLVLCCYHEQAALVLSTFYAISPTAQADRIIDTPAFLSDGCVDPELFANTKDVNWDRCWFLFPPTVGQSELKPLSTCFQSWASRNRLTDRSFYQAGYKSYGVDAMHLVMTAMQSSQSATGSSPLHVARGNFAISLARNLELGQSAIVQRYRFAKSGESEFGEFWCYKATPSRLSFTRITQLKTEAPE
jgi:hypothetical protein